MFAHRQVKPEEIPLLHKQLDGLVMLLLEEEITGDSTNEMGAGPCMEFFLKQKILKHLCEMAEDNHPQGMNAWGLQAISRIFHHMSPTFLVQMSVHEPLAKLIEFGAIHPDRLNRKEFLNLISHLIVKLKEDPSLLGLFFNEIKDGGQTIKDFVIFKALMRLYASKEDLAIVQGGISPLGNMRPKINSSLLHLLHRNILSCLQFQDTDVEECVNQSKFVNVLVEELVSLYKSLPAQLNSNQLQMEEFIQHIHFLNSISKLTNNGLFSTQLVHLVAKRFFEDTLTPLLSDEDLEVVNLHTIYLCEALMQVDSQALLDAAVEFLFGSSQTPENKRVPEQHLIRSLLISRIDYLELYKQALHRATQTGQTVHRDIYCHLGINTLKLIDTLFERNNETIFHTLILKNFYTRGESLLSKNAPKIKLEELLELAPSQNKDEFMRDINLHFEYSKPAVSLGLRHVLKWNNDPIVQTSLNKKPNTAESSPNWAHHEFYEGLFLRTIFSSLDQFTEHSLDYALFLTNIIARLAQHPHPLVQKYLLLSLDIPVPDLNIQRTLFSVLKKISSHMIDFVNGEQIQDRLVEVRADMAQAKTSIFLGDNTRPVRLIVIFEDFIKELFSIFSVAEVHIADSTIINT